MRFDLALRARRSGGRRGEPCAGCGGGGEGCGLIAARRLMVPRIISSSAEAVVEPCGLSTGDVGGVVAARVVCGWVVVASCKDARRGLRSSS